MPIQQFLKEELPRLLPQLFLAAVVGLLTIAGIEGLAALMPALDDPHFQQAILALLLVSILLNIAFGAWWFWNRPVEKLKLAFGVYWDDKMQPHCPACECPLSNLTQYDDGMGFQCMKCKGYAMLGDIPKPSSLETVQNLVRERLGKR